MYEVETVGNISNKYCSKYDRASHHDMMQIQLKQKPYKCSEGRISR